MRDYTHNEIYERWREYRILDNLRNEMENEKQPHRARTLAIKGGAYVGVCSCGWVSSDFPDREPAIQTTNLHVVQSLRRHQQPPKAV